MKKRWVSLLTAICFICGITANVSAQDQSAWVGISEDEILDEAAIAAYSEDDVITTYVGSTQISTYNPEGNTIAEVSGADRYHLIKWLTKHINDNYYLTTPYLGGDCRNPNGDRNGQNGVMDMPGVANMNCTGFVWHALTSAGGHNIPAVVNWIPYLRNNNIEYRTYLGNNADDIINTVVREDDYAEPGDIMWLWDANAGEVVNGVSNGVSDVHHVGIFTGSYFDYMPHNYNYYKELGDPNGFWHSGNGTNQITNIAPLSRCEAITVIKLGGDMPQTTFYDVSDNGWYLPYILDVNTKGLMTGYNAAYFGTTDNLTRGQFATILYRISESPSVEYQTIFEDVPDKRFDSLPITWASQLGVVTGYNDNRFQPDAQITREEMVTMLQRYAKSMGADVSMTADCNQFPDGASVSAFALNAMQWAVASGIISGNSDGTLAPQGSVSRAVCATIISRYSESSHLQE